MRSTKTFRAHKASSDIDINNYLITKLLVINAEQPDNTLVAESNTTRQTRTLLSKSGDT